MGPLRRIEQLSPRLPWGGRAGDEECERLKPCRDTGCRHCIHGYQVLLGSESAHRLQIVYTLRHVPHAVVIFPGRSAAALQYSQWDSL